MDANIDIIQCNTLCDHIDKGQPNHCGAIFRLLGKTTLLNESLSWARWCVPVVPAAWEAKVGRNTWAQEFEISQCKRDRFFTKQARDMKESSRISIHSALESGW
jgi:hypothetical protein